MVDRRVINKKDVAQIGLRIKASRVLTSFNQEEFAEKHNFGYASLKNWELGKSIPRDETVLSLITAFRDSRVQTTRDWLLYGSGSGPTHLNDSDNLNNTADSGFEREVLAFERWCSNNGKRPIVTNVLDNLMEPFFSIGDTVGAEEVNIDLINSAMIKKPLLVEIDPGHFQPRFLGYNSTGIIKYAQTNQGNLIKELQYSGLGKIIWIRKNS